MTNGLCYFPCALSRAALAVFILAICAHVEAYASAVGDVPPVSTPNVELAPVAVREATGELGKACGSWLATPMEHAKLPAAFEEPEEKICSFVADPVAAEYGYWLTGAIVLLFVLIPIGLLLGLAWAAFGTGARLFRRLVGNVVGGVSWPWQV